MSNILSKLPQVRGNYRENAEIARTTWFKVGGPAEVLYRPADLNDLQFFLQTVSPDISLTILGVGSNCLIRDGGIKGVCIKLGREFTSIKYSDELLEVGAATLNYNLATFCRNNSLTNLEFLVGIPGCIGGGIAMNAGAYGSDFSSYIDRVEAIDKEGNIFVLRNEDIGFIYRGNSLEPGWIFTKAYFKIRKGDKNQIANKMQQITIQREKTQPIKEKSSGSSFANPVGYRAWELIDKSGCRGLKLGDAQISEKHCNFIINNGSATAKDIESLGEEVKKRVKENFNINLEWEIKIVGEY